MLHQVFAICLLVGAALSADMTRVPNSNGADVVEAVVNIIRESCLFADDKRFLRRLAYVESEDGMSPNTYRPGYHGGIWQVDEAAFLQTQNQANLTREYSLIRSRIGINWSLVTWSDLRMPLYSGVAAALFTLLKGPGGDAITWKTEEQGQFWSKNFHSGSSATNFTQLANLLDLGPNSECWDGNHSRWYTGNISVTWTGRTCQAWAAQSPHGHTRNRDDMFPYDGSAQSAKNYCRDPDNEGTPWCYTMDQNKRWEHCNVPICTTKCVRDEKYSRTSPPTSPNGSNILDATGCHTNQQVDLVFVVDSSSSLSMDDFNRALTFVTMVASGFKISPTDTRVGLVTYSTDIRVEFTLDRFSTFSAIQSAVSSVMYHSGATATADAIDKAVNEVFSQAHGGRAGVVKVMVVITDGDSDDAINTRHAAERAQAESIVVFSVGVGRAIHINELNTIASNPDCTHAYQVRNYEEIRFLTEEIQHATCIAPLFINTTYSCEISRCPQLAVVSPNGGVTIETNITCGGMNIYSSFNNPYPNKAQYQTVVPSTAGHPTQNFYNATSGETLYMSLKDNQGIPPKFNGSAGCIATVTPYYGDRTDKPIVRKCFKDSQEVTCPDSNCTEKWNFPNPCTPENIKTGNLRFPHPYDANKFIMCDLTGTEYIVICPPGTVFQAASKACIGSGSVPSGICQMELDTTVVANPCSADHILAGLLYFEYPLDGTKYIQCDIWGHPCVMGCRPGFEWVQKDVTCVVIPPSPCHNHDDTQPFLYPHPCDPHRFIHCDTNGQGFIQNCQRDYLFLPASQTCAPIGFPGTENLVNTCNGATQPPAIYTTMSGSTREAGYLHSVQLWQAPCTKQNIAQNLLYFPYRLNNHQYIQCDIDGRQYLRDCSDVGRDYYDPDSHTCVTGPVHVDSIISG